MIVYSDMSSSKRNNASSTSARKRSVLSTKFESTSTKAADVKRTVICYCPHCDSSIEVKTFRKHKSLYYNYKQKSWIKVDELPKSETSACLGNEEALPPELPMNLGSSGQCSVDMSADIMDTSEVIDDQSYTSDDSEDVGEQGDIEIPSSDDEEEVWEDEEAHLHLKQDFDSPDLPLQDESPKSKSSLVSWLVLFLLRLQARYYLPDIAISCLLKFLYTFLVIIGKHSDFVAKLAENFPRSIYCLRKYWELDNDFLRLVVCRHCYSVYEKKSCMEKEGTCMVSKVCTYREHRNSKKTCGTVLLKTVRLLNGKTVLYPFKVFCYRSLKVSLQHLLQRPGFSELCDHWRSLSQCSNGNLRDIYDGKLWKDFQNYNGKPFLATPHTYALMLNLDWFQPYKRTQSSIGALYMTIMNLPYEQRFKRENVILLGIIPGPCEPPRDVNQYLRPLVKELLHFWEGIQMNVYGNKELQVVKCGLIGVPCDMPAGRKACGFLSHSASLDCTKCLKEFPGSVGCKDYSGFDRENWNLREVAEHRSNVRLIQQAKTKTQRNCLESKYGCRYSVLLELPYFDPTRMLIIDPMHNLFLGTAKHMKTVWMTGDNPVLDSTQLQSIQKIVDNIHVPTDIGRIPRKIETNFSGFTADQFKNWVNAYSIPCLYHFLENEHLECWRHFVLACRFLCKKSISETDVTLADGLLLQFCRHVERLYGKKAVTPNMHMHCHLKSVILDYGPVYGFWLFAYERYNGILEHQPTNSRCIEIQLMSRFLRDNFAYAIQPPDDFQELNDLCILRQNQIGSLKITTLNQSNSFEYPGSCTCHVFSDSEIQCLRQLLLKLNLITSEDVAINSSYHRYKFVTIKNIRISSSNSKHKSILMAAWNQDIYGNSPTALPRLFTHTSDANLHPVQVLYFVKFNYICSDSICTQCFVRVSWFQPHPSRFALGKPAQAWCMSAFERDGLYSFLPLDYLSCRCVYTCMKIHNENVLVVIPIVESFQ